MFRTKCVEKIKTHFIYNNFFSENLNCYEKLWKNVVETDTQQMTIWPMRISSWIPQAIDTHSEYAIIIAHPQQQ